MCVHSVAVHICVGGIEVHLNLLLFSINALVEYFLANISTLVR